MDKKRVSVLRCEEYEYDRVRQTVYEAFDAIGVTREMLSGKRVFIKANLVLKCPPERCATTHPTVIAAIAQYVADMGGQAVIGDSPGGPLQNTRMDSIYDVAGMTEAAERTGAELN